MLPFANDRICQIALTAFHGVGHSTSRLICARLGLHDRLHVSELTEPQINQLSALLSSPTSFMGEAPSSTPSTSASTSGISATQQQREHDRLANLVIESDLRKVVRDNISHHRAIGTYRGRRFAMQLPVRGQRTKTNAQTARKLNRVDRRNFSTSTSSMAGSTRYVRGPATS